MRAVKTPASSVREQHKVRVIIGHAMQVISALVAAADSFLEVPLSARIHKGVQFTTAITAR